MMFCPLCVDEVLDVTHHGGIEIDVCPRCRGLWLDRGELDRLLGEPDDSPGEVFASPAGSARPVGESTTGARRRDDDRGGRGLDPDDKRYDRDDDDDDDEGRSRGKGRTPRRRRLMDRLGDALEEVLDL